MANCPKCKEEIDGLAYSYPRERSGVYWGDGDWECDDYDDSEATLRFYCLDCEELIANCEEDADKFLEGVPIGEEGE